MVQPDNPFETHRPLLDGAVRAIRERGYWSGFPESPRSYGKESPAEGRETFTALLGKPFYLHHVEVGELIGGEVSPFGPVLGITYPKAETADLIARALRAAPAWADAEIDARTGVALEILTRLNRSSFVIAHSVEHTTGQAFPMAFQAGGPHAQDRGLEAVAYAYEAMKRIPAAVRWEKPVGSASIRLDKNFRIVPRGIALVIGCATFPTWNTYPAIFADLVTGNAVIVKPHPAAVLPLALTVRIAREVLDESGFDPNVIQLAVDTVDQPIAKELATRPEVGLVDFTGSPAFGTWLRKNVSGKPLFTEEAGVNSIVIDSTDEYEAMCKNIAFSLTLYSGQMCTAPQCLFVPKDGIETNEGHKSLDEVAKDISASIDELVADPARALLVTGAIQNPATMSRIETVRKLGRIVRESVALQVQGARTATPLLLSVDADREDAYLQELFGPISFVVACDDTADAVARATGAARNQGAITAALYTRDAALMERVAPAYAGAGVPLSVNLTGNIFVNQSAAFSDYHVSGANPAGNACLTDAAFVAPRFTVVSIRRPVAA